jgi:hypothetical protein
MHKVIVERPRILRGGWTNRKTSLRLSSSQCAAAADSPEDYDSGARRASSGRHGKRFNENLAPLRRYLLKQVGRPWDKVYGEICQTIDTRSTVGLHVLQHLTGFVSVNTFLQDGVVYEQTYRYASPVKGLYVHPVTKLLRCTKNWRRRKKKHMRTQKEELLFVRASDTVTYEKIDGLWFRMEYRRLAADECVERGDGSIVRAAELGRGPHVTLVRKQQCDRKTIQRLQKHS